MLKEMRNFLQAAYRLTEAWDNETGEEVDLLHKVNFPFSESFDEVVEKIEKWVTDYEKLSRRPVIVRYVVCTGGKDFEHGWFFEAVEKDRRIFINDKTSPTHRVEISHEDLMTNFIEVPKSLYDNYIKAIEEGDHDKCISYQEEAIKLKEDKK